jgi:hypothetical protein
MTDSPKPPAKPDDLPPVKDAIPDGKGEAMPQAKPLTFGQQLFIWSMIVIVGVLFGMGATFPFLTAPEPKLAGNVSQTEAIQRMQTAERLERVLNANGHPYYPKFAQPRWQENGLEAYASDIRLAQVAEGRNLMPKGKALDLLEREFLATPLEGSTGRTYLDALREHEGGVDQINRQDLRRFLAERAARDGLYIRSAIAPAVPRAMAADMASVRGDRAELVEVVLDATHLLPEVKLDDPEVATAYERLRGTRFTRPASVTVAIAWADSVELAAAETVSDEDAKAWYGAHTDRFMGEVDPKDPSKKPEPKPFDQVKAEVVKALQSERGSAAAQRLADAFNLEAEILEGERDPAKFRAAAATAKLKLAEQVVEDRTPGTLDLGALGTVKDVARLFGKEHEPGFISPPLPTSVGHWVMLRLEKRNEAGFQELDAVRPQVAAYVAGRRAYKPLLEQAGLLRDKLKTTGTGALSAWAASDEAKPWKPSVTTKPQPLITPLKTPPAEADGIAGDPVVVAALAVAGSPVAVIQAEPAWEGDVPRVRLVQVAELKPGSREGLAEGPLAEAYRNALRRFGLVLFDRELQAQVEGK